jgi:antitoxin PrlF
MVSAPRLVRIQEKGQVTLPADVRKRLGLKKGDLVAVVATPDGVLITPQEVVATKALNQIGAILREQGVSLEELIEAGQDIRDELVRELYGIDPASQPK